MLVRTLRQSEDTTRPYLQPFVLPVSSFINLAALQNQYGRETGDLPMVMATARSRTSARRADTVARADDSPFVLLMKGPVNATQANSLATKILASGPCPSNWLPGGEHLRFHIVSGHFGESAGLAFTEAAAYQARTHQAVKALNDGARKTIRLVWL